ncbi:MAG: hypothetical protein K0R57_5443 [Paenibacillaceae bacterium]|nr:hypothetical protein [Paenibacillaceae bacterium]
METLNKCDYKNRILEDLCDTLEIDNEDSIKIFNFLRGGTDSSLLSHALVAMEDETGSNRQLLLPNGLYYINVKTTTLIMIAFVLDITLTHGVLTTFLGLTGSTSKTISIISPEHGETCILREALLSKEQTVNKNVLIKNGKECVNHDIRCLYRNEEECRCSPEEVDNILLRLSNKNIFKKIAQADYQLNS